MKTTKDSPDLERGKQFQGLGWLSPESDFSVWWVQVREVPANSSESRMKPARRVRVVRARAQGGGRAEKGSGTRRAGMGWVTLQAPVQPAWLLSFTLPRVSLSLWSNTQAQRLGTGRAGRKARGVESDFLGEEVVLLLV